MGRKDREAIACLLAAIVEDGAAAVLGLEAQNERGQSTPIEIMMLPLRHEGPNHTRILGCYAPLKTPYWLGLHPVVRQPVQSLRLIWPDERPSFLMTADEAAAVAPAPEPAAIVRTARPAAGGGRRVGHLRVIEGGRQDA